MARRWAAAAVAVWCLVLTSCAAPLAPAPLDDPFVLAPRERAFVEDANIRLEFLEVTADSRCPIDAICVWAGDATVHITVRDDGTSVRYDLHTGDPARATVVHGGLVIRLVELQPYPASTRPIALADYRATFRITR
jgi:hypothetical protein